MPQGKEKSGPARAEAKNDEFEQRNQELESTPKSKQQSKHTDLGDRLREVLEVRILK